MIGNVRKYLQGKIYKKKEEKMWVEKLNRKGKKGKK